ncbi:MFS transporter [Amycolatopsis nigrescens]|uniref:MFS transporter n=1 Tax=Amycolatopsis nigrescens TaxID=381445 RepID=UPI000375A148|nr:MFS transporter [Amycolatopsis nigrescens]
MSQLNRPAAVLACVVIVQFMASLDLSVVNVALPAIQSDLGFDQTALQWVVNAYALVYGGFMLLGGRLGDVLGRRRVLFGGLAVFALASLLGGFATAPGQLIAVRAVQGLGAAVLSPAALALVSVTFEAGKARSRALGLWAISTVVGGAVGVLAGGVLTQSLDWRWVLWINLPIAALALAAAATGVRESRPESAPKLDFLGAALVTAGMALLILGVARTDEYPWTSPMTIGTLAIALVLLAAFVVVERKITDPLLDLRLFRHRALAGANLFGFLITAGQLAGFYFVSLHMQQVLHYSPAMAGLAFLPFCAGAVAGMQLATRMMPSLGARGTLLAGGLLGGAGIAWFGAAGPGGSFVADLLGPSLVASVGIGAGFVAMGAAATGGVPAADAGMASGIINSSRQLGGSIGLAALTTIAAGVTTRSSATADDALSAGYSVALYVGGALIVAGALVAWALVPANGRRDGRQRAAVTAASG